MNKRFYLALNLLLGLLVAIELFQSSFQFLIGQEVFKLKAYLPWFWASGIISTIMSLLLLKYYWSRKYWLAFSTAVAMTVMLTILSLIFYMTLASTTMQVYYLFSLLIFHGITLIYSSCLVFSASGKRFWLRASGIFMYLISAFSIILILFSGYVNSPDFYAQIDKISIWLSVASSLVPILFIINFNAEIRQLKETDKKAPSWKFSTIALYVLVALSIMAVVAFGAMLGNAVYHSKAHDVKSGIKTYNLTETERRICDSLHIDTTIIQDIRESNSEKIEPFHYSLSKVYVNGKTEEADPVHLQGLVFPSDSAESFKLIFDLKDRVKQKGYTIFMVEQHFNINKEKDVLGILKTTDKYQILKQIKTDGINYDIDNDSLIHIIREFDKTCTLELISASGEGCEFVIHKEPKDWTAFAKTVYKICPDVVDQGVGSVDELAKQMKNTKRLPLVGLKKLYRQFYRFFPIGEQIFSFDIHFLALPLSKLKN